MVAGEPGALYLHHRVRLPTDLEPYFKGNNAPVPMKKLPIEIADASRVLWQEVVSRPEVRAHLSIERPFHRAFDHLNHILDAGWESVGAPPTHIRWSREIELPNGRGPGPSESLTIGSLSAGAQAAVLTLETVARQGADAALDAALSRKAAW
jgi:hypothetical protein